MKRFTIRGTLFGILIFSLLFSLIFNPKPVNANGLEEKIFFSDNNHIYSLNPDGTSPTVIFDQFSNGFDVSQDGKTIVYDSNGSIWRVNVDGSGQTKLVDSATLQSSLPTWSLDGSKIAFLVLNPSNFTNETYIMNADGSGVQFVVEGGGYPGPSWSPDGTRLLISQQVDEGSRLVTALLDGTDVETVLESSDQTLDSPAWSPNGDKAVFRSSLNEEPYSSAINTINLDGSGQATLYAIPSGESALALAWSPDATKIAFLKYSSSWSGLATIPSTGGSVTDLFEASIPDTPVRWGNIFVESPDQTPPTVSNLRLSRRVVTSFGIVPLTITADATDDLSGVMAGEFYIDNDPGVGNGTPMTYANGQITTQTTINNLQTGIHTIYVRAKDNAGNWTTTVSARFLYLNL